MTHNQWEHGERLTMHNATKEQLKFMVKDRDRQIKDLQEKLQSSEQVITQFSDLFTEILSHKSGQDLIMDAASKRKSYREAVIRSAIDNYHRSILFGFSDSTAQAVETMEQTWTMCSPWSVTGIDELDEAIREAKEKFKNELEEPNEPER